MPGPTVGQTLPAEHPFVKACAFSKYTLAVAVRKEAEQRATSIYDLFAPSEPVASLDDFLDGESLVQEDLVAWVSLGKEHLPRTESDRGARMCLSLPDMAVYFDILPRKTCTPSQCTAGRLLAIYS